MSWSYQLVHDLPDLPDGPLGLDIETTGLRHWCDDIVLVTVVTEQQAWVVPVQQHDTASIRSWLDEVVFRRDRLVVIHNAIFDVVFLRRRYGITWPRVVYDTKIAEQILCGGLDEDCSLASLARRYIGIELDKSVRETFTPGAALTPEQVEYAAIDALVLLPIAREQVRRIRSDHGLSRVLGVELSAQLAFWRMQEQGVAVDLSALEQAERGWQAEAEELRKHLQTRLTQRVLASREAKLAEAEEALRRWQSDLEAELSRHEEMWRSRVTDPSWEESLREDWLGYQVTDKTVMTEKEIQSWLDPAKGLKRYLQRVQQRFRREHPKPPTPKVNLFAPINLLSSQQLLEALNEELREAGLPAIRSTEAKVLRSLLGRNEELDHEVLRPLLRYKELEKLLIFAEQIREHSDDGVLYPDWQQIGAATGRASCRNPNLMAQPKRANFRSLFVARPGMVLVTADYSQIELRILAALSGDLELNRVFRTGQDLHRLTASRIFGIPEEQVTEKQRKVGKQVNFGIVYGMGPRRLMAELAAQGIQLSLEEARNALESWRRTYRRAAEWIAARGEEAVRDGATRTALGRIRRYAPASSEEERAAIRRQGGNLPIQGTAADIMKVAMGRLWRYNPVIQVHDELVLEVPERDAQAVSQLVKRVMKDVAEEILGVPVDVSVRFGRVWAEEE